jgi:hypothetical protein
MDEIAILQNCVEIGETENGRTKSQIPRTKFQIPKTKLLRYLISPFPAAMLFSGGGAEEGEDEALEFAPQLVNGPPLPAEFSRELQFRFSLHHSFHEPEDFRRRVVGALKGNSRPGLEMGWQCEQL